MKRARRTVVSACAVVALLAGMATGQVPPAGWPIVHSDGHTRIADPKLSGGGAQAAFHLEPATASMSSKAVVHDAGGPMKTIWTGVLQGGAPPTVVTWDGKNQFGRFADTGDYTLHVGAVDGTGPELVLSITLVRLGITEIEFQDSPSADDEWQMVYFKKGTVGGVFFETPAIHEYFNTRDPGGVSDLDLDNGLPRPPVAVHTATDEPVMNGGNYEIERYNYPLAYIKGSSPRLEATLGNGGTSTSGAPMSAGYPVSGYDLRVVADFGSGWTAASGPITPGGTVTLDGPALPGDVDRHSLPITWRFEYSPSGAGTWSAVLGTAATDHRVYTLHDSPKFPNQTGTQYKGPWVEIAEYLAIWKSSLGTSTSTDGGVVETFVKGFFGQNGGIPTAIEGVQYDTIAGSANYWALLVSGAAMNLSALLNGAHNGVSVNCDDTAAATSASLAMLGIPNIKRLKLSQMQLNAIWGIGTPSYTTALFSGGGHVFVYHMVVTRTDGNDIIDTCMQLDEDGNPSSTPGTPGWNVDRPWAGPGGYDDLSNSNNVNQQGFAGLPKLL